MVSFLSEVRAGMYTLNGKTIEAMPGVSGLQVKSGLGFNVSQNNEWEFDRAKEAGATEVRFQPAWSQVENATTGVLALPTAYSTALNWCQSKGLEPMLVAAYGSPWERMGLFTLAQTATQNSMTLVLDQSLAGLNAADFRLHLRRSNGQFVSSRNDYAGALITGLDESTNTVTLASALTSSLGAGTELEITRVRYASCINQYPFDDSIQAYRRYARYLADQISARSIHGRVEIWNEPFWKNSPWDWRGYFYDNQPTNLVTGNTSSTGFSPNFGLADALKGERPTNVRFVWGGSHKSGYSSLLRGRRTFTLTQADAAGSLSYEAFHPYCNVTEPERAYWDPEALVTVAPSNTSTCMLVNADPNNNFKDAHKSSIDALAANGWTVDNVITETGSDASDEAVQARSILRTFLVAHAVGIKRVNFYRLAATDGTNQGFAFMGNSNSAVRQPFTAIKRLMDEVKTFSLIAPIESEQLPSVKAYSGDWPLLTVPIRGRVSGGSTRNAIAFVLWQHTYANDWQALASPAPKSVSITLPTTATANVHRVGSVYNLRTGAAIPYTVSGMDVTFDVSDDPVMLRICEI